MNNNLEKKSNPTVLYCFTGQLKTQLDSSSKYGIAEVLAKLGWRVILVSADEEGESVLTDVEELCFPVPDIYILRNMVYNLKVVQYLLRNWNKVDVVLFGQPSAPILFLIKLWRKVRGDFFPLFILDTRTVPMEDPKKATLRDKIRALLYASMNAIGNRWADGQTVITGRMAELLKMPKEQVLSIWPSGADVTLFSRSRKLRHWPTEDEPIQLAYIGVLHYERNLMALCKATVMANREGMRFKLTITGAGTEQEDLKKFAARSNGQVQVNDPVPHDQVPRVLAMAHVGVLPFPDEMKYRVSSPIKLFEYLASGLVIMATRVVCHTDVLQDEPVVFWAENATVEGMFNALRQIWTERMQLARYGKEAERVAENFTWEASGKKLSIGLHAGIDRQLEKMHSERNRGVARTGK